MNTSAFNAHVNTRALIALIEMYMLLPMRKLFVKLLRRFDIICINLSTGYVELTQMRDHTCVCVVTFPAQAGAGHLQP